MRDWLWVEDHASAIDKIFSDGKVGESYNVGGLNEWTNIELVKYLCKILDEKLDREKGESEKLITLLRIEQVTIKDMPLMPRNSKRIRLEAVNQI